MNSVIIGFGSTFLSIFLGTLAAYAFSRFRVPLKDDLMFFILSTRMMPPIAVAIPIFLMYRQLGLSRHPSRHDPALHGGEPVAGGLAARRGSSTRSRVEYEEAALIDGYTRFQAFRKVVLPQATTGIASTAIFCLIFAWNEYAFAVLLTSGNAADGAALHPDDHRRGRTGLAGGGGRRRRCSWCRSWSSPSCCASTCCAASPSGRCANDRLSSRLAAAAPRRAGRCWPPC